MARIVDKLTARSVETARATGTPRMIPDGRGLYLRVWPSDAKSWIFRYQHDGQRHDLGIGPYPEISLADARDRATDQRRLLKNDGRDPLTVKRERQSAARASSIKAMTFKEAAERYMAAHRSSWKHPKHRQQWTGTLSTYAYPAIGALSVTAIDTAIVMQVLDPIWTVKPETASRLRGRIEAVLDWSTARGYRKGENPARWKGHLENILPKKSKVRRVEHHAALPYAELGRFVAELRQQEGIAVLAFEFAILTVARTSEVLGARWNEVDFKRRLWVIPAERMKMAKEHRVPLCDRAFLILAEMAEIRTSDFMFPGKKAGKPLSDTVFQKLLRHMGRTNLTAHGFRSTFSDWCTEQTDFPSEAREMALAHAVGSKVEQAYRRGDLFEKRRQLMTAWETFIGGRRDRLTRAA